MTCNKLKVEFVLLIMSPSPGVYGDSAKCPSTLVSHNSSCDGSSGDGPWTTGADYNVTSDEVPV